MEISRNMPPYDLFAFGGGGWDSGLWGGLLLRGHCHLQGFFSKGVWKYLAKGEGTLSVYSRYRNESTILWWITSLKKFPHKQMSEHAKIRNTDNTEDLRKNSEAEKTTEEREFTIIRKNYNGSRVCCDYKCSRITLFLPPSCWKRKDIYIFSRWCIVDVNIMDGCNRKIGMCKIFVTARIGRDLMQKNLHLSIITCFILEA